MIVRQIAPLFAALICVCAIYAVPIEPASAFIIHGGAASGSGPTGLITTMQLANNTGSSIPANSITPMFGMEFKKGDLPSGCAGSAPILKIHSDGTVIPYSESVKPICWADGSLKQAAFLARDPESIAASTAYSISSCTYSDTTGVIACTLASTPTFTTGTVVLSGLAGTGQYASLAQQWAILSVAGTSINLQGPVSTNGNATVTSGTLTQPSYVAVDIYSGGTTPANSSRTTADYTAGALDLNRQVTGLDNVTGTYEADLSDGITNYGTVKFMDGAVGRVDTVWSDFKKSGTAHGQLMGRWYVAALQDASGNLAGIRYLSSVTAPWYNVVSPAANFWSFTADGDYNGASLLQDQWGSHGTAFNFTWASGATLNATIPSLLQTGNLIRLTTTGTLPTGLSTGTSYYFYNGIGPAGGPYSYTAFNLGTNSAGVTDGGGIIAPTGAGSGTQTAQAYPYITQFGANYDAQSNGRWNYVQGAGSIATDTVIQVLPNMTYLRSTRLIPPYAFGTQTPSENVSYPYNLMTGGPFTRYLEDTGERPDLGPFNYWETLYMFNQSAVDDQNIRTMGLVAGQLPLNFRDQTTRQLVVPNGGTYTGMPAGSTSIRWDASTPAGFTFPANSSVWIAGYNEIETSHIPDFAMAAWLITGEPEYMEELEELGDEAVYDRYAPTGTASVGATTSIGNGSPRNTSVAGTTYYGITLGGGNLLRTDAWARRNVSEAVFASAGDPGCSSCYRLFDDMSLASENAEAAYIGMFGSSYPWVTNNGMWDETNTAAGGISDSWSAGYFLNAWNLSVNWTEDANITTFLSYLVKWPAHVHSTFGTSYIAYPQAIVRQSNNSFSSPFVTSDADVGFQGHLVVAWTASSATFTISGLATGYTPTNGDMVMFNDQETVPAGLTGETPYFWCNISGSTGNLSTNYPACSGIVTPTGSGSINPYFYSTSLQPPYSLSGICDQNSYGINVLSSLQFAKALGISVDATTLSDLTTLVTNTTSPGTWPGCVIQAPTYLYQSSF